MKLYESLAQAFIAEGVEAFFGLMGDGNWRWMKAMASDPGVTMFSVRHEHSAVVMAMGYWSLTGKIGIATITHGPGFTQIMTALTAAARNHVPLVILAGETPLSSESHLQRLDQAPLAKACGADYVQIHHPSTAHYQVRKAFTAARRNQRPVVLGVPSDTQELELPSDLPRYKSSLSAPRVESLLVPEPQAVRSLAAELAAARCPVIIAGRGALKGGARDVIEALADASGALLGTTLLAKGMYDRNPFCLGVIGGYARDASREVARSADLVIAIGASLSKFTMDHGLMFPSARVVQIDSEPAGILDGRAEADFVIRADAKLAATALLVEFGRIGSANSSVRSKELAHRLRTSAADPTPYEVDDGTLDPRLLFQALQTVIPREFELVGGPAHQAYWHTVMRGGDPERYHAIREFGAVGNTLCFAAGIASAKRDGGVVAIEGDGGLLMHIQEFETLKRHGIKLLLICCNDGAFGAEVHRLRADGLSDAGAVFGRTDFASIAGAFGIRGVTVTDLSLLPSLMSAYRAQPDAEIWNVHISDRVLAPDMRHDIDRHVSPQPLVS